jgi:uncharacterized protein (TIGR02453 family)
MAFQGFSDDTIPFYRELHDNNDRTFWQANRARYDEGIRAPMLTLLDELSSAFGEAKLFRPYRDVRFSKDKRPYKENIAATLGGRYLSLGRDGLYVGAGAFRMQGDTLARYRAAVADTAGGSLEAILDALDDEGFRLAEPELSRGPTGYPRDHPRIELLKHKSVTATRHFGVPDWLTEPSALDHIAETFAELEGLASWVERHVR